MSTQLTNSGEQTLKKKTLTPVIDCDIHPNPRSYNDLLPYMNDYWRDYMVDCKFVGIFPGVPPLTLVTNAGHRTDAIPPEGGMSCSSLPFFREQVADKYNYAIGILNPDSTFNLAASPQAEMATNLAAAYNDWQIDQWLSKDPSLRGTVVVASQDPIAAAREIDRVGSHPQIVQVGLSIRCPYGGWGSKRYQPIWEAAIRNGLIVNFHVSSPGGLFKDGYEANYGAESQTNNGLTFQAAISSIVFGGVLEKYQDLKMIFVEGGFGWVPNLMYTMDTHWRMLVREVPWVKRPPSQQVREQLWFGTQPLIEPERPEDFKHIFQLIEMIGEDKIVFASDYPHFTFDAPQAALAKYPAHLRNKILYENALELFGFPKTLVNV